MSKKVISLILCIALAVSLTLTGCGSTQTASETVTAVNTVSQDSEDSVKGTTFTGIVQSVTDNQITVSVMSGDMGQQGGMEQPGDMGQGGQPGQAGSTGNASSGSSGTPPEMPSGSSDNSSTPPSMPGNDGSSANGGSTPPEMPSGSGNGGSNAPSGNGGSQPDMSSGSGNGSTPPEKPSDNGTGSSSSSGSAGEGSQSGQAGGMQADMQTVVLTICDTSALLDESGSAVELSAIAEGTMLTVTVEEDGTISAITVGSTMDFSQQPSDMGGGMGGGMGGQSSANITYSAVNEYSTDADVANQTISSTGTDESAVLLDSDSTVTLSGVTVNRTSSDSTGGDNSSFYGVGAAVLATDGTLNVSDSTITTDSAGGAGVFAYGDATVNVSNTTITTKQDTSGGIHAAGGGTLNAENCTVETSGESSAAIRSDRGGGTMNVTGGSYTSNGTGSPAVYCTADITVSDADLTANGSEAVCIEGLNSLTLTNCDLTGSMSDDDRNECTWNIIVYQSMSGDSEVGNGTFSMTGGTLTAKNGGMFYTTNTDSTFFLSNVDITYAAENDFFLRCTGNSNARGWGSSGSNGANCTFTADNQAMQGDIIYDSISTLKFIMQNGSTLTGAIVDDESCAGSGGSGTCTVTIGKTSVWVVTGDSTVTSLTNAGTIVDANGNTVSIVGTDGTVYVSGTSSYTVTVGSYN